MHQKYGCVGKQTDVPGSLQFVIRAATLGGEVFTDFQGRNPSRQFKNLLSTVVKWVVGGANMGKYRNKYGLCN